MRVFYHHRKKLCSTDSTVLQSKAYIAGFLHICVLKVALICAIVNNMKCVFFSKLRVFRQEMHFIE